MKILILVRHAHRDKHGGSHLDNGLSPKGILQAQAIKDFFLKHYAGQKTLLISSPKLRCRETLQPLAHATGGKIFTEPLIGEEDELRKRVKKFWEWWIKDAPSLVVACSHGDWIPEFVDYTTGGKVECSKGSWCELGDNPERPQILNLYQDVGAHL